MPIINFSKDAVKPIRRVAFDHIKTLHSNTPMTREKHDAIMEELILYFSAPPVRRPAASALEWVARAVSAQDVRAYLCYLWVSPEGVAYGTDGHRAHFAAVEGIAPGFYDPKTLKPAEVDGKYPDINRLMPKTWPDSSAALVDLERKLLVNDGEDRPIYSHGAASVMQVYLNDALNGCEAMPIEIHGEGGSAKWVGVNEYGSYLIMGLRV